MYNLITTDIVKWAREYKGERFHACLCDPPYHLTSIVKRFGKASIDDDTYTSDKIRRRADGYSRLIGTGFMGARWDGGDVAFRSETWEAIGNCLFPGAYLLAFGGTRTFHRLACAIEDAGFEIRDTVMWVYGSGFPKSHDVSKAIDREAGLQREIIGKRKHPTLTDTDKIEEQANAAHGNNSWAREWDITTPATDLAKTWDGYGSALKPAWEPIIVARKSLEGTIAQNCAKYGSGAINIDGCRVEVEDKENYDFNRRGFHERMGNNMDVRPYKGGWKPNNVEVGEIKGRWPANLVIDDSEEVRNLFPQTGKSQGGRSGHTAAYSGGYKQEFYGDEHPGYGDSGSAARFFMSCPVEPLCALCGLPMSERRDIIKESEEDISCQDNASSAEKNTSQNAMDNDSAEGRVLLSGQQDKEGKKEESSTSVLSVERSSSTTQAIEKNSALASADVNIIEEISRRAQSVANLCEKCATAIARNIVAMRRGQDQELPHGWDSISERKGQILTQCLVSFVALLGNTDTIPTTDSLSLLFGSVFHAIENCTEPTSEKTGKAICHPTRLRYCSKASKSERNAGCEDIEEKESQVTKWSGDGMPLRQDGTERKMPLSRNNHPCIKPLSLCEYLARLILPPREYAPRRLLVPFSGSGSECIGAHQAGWDEIVGVELQQEYVDIAEARLKYWTSIPKQLELK